MKVSLINQVHPETLKRALVMAGHDIERIKRLVDNVRLKNPDRPEQWYWDKIVYDMERDRN
jgi:hypothetical protein